jgi:hypothetical protein
MPQIHGKKFRLLEPARTQFRRNNWSCGAGLAFLLMTTTMLRTALADLRSPRCNLTGQPI